MNRYALIVLVELERELTDAELEGAKMLIRSYEADAGMPAGRVVDVRFKRVADLKAKAEKT